MIDVLEIIESVERARAGRIKKEKIDILAITEAVEQSSPSAPIPKAMLGKIIGDATARPACAVNRSEEECVAPKPAGSKQSAVGIYCWQISQGPQLTIKRDLTKENLPEDWFEQHIRSISSSVLDRFHGDSVRKIKSARSDAEFGEPLPMQEAKRIVKILQGRIDEPKTASQERVFLQTAIRRGLEYIDAWDQIKKFNRKASE